MIEKIRKRSFAKRIPYSIELKTLVQHEPSHSFLVNPASQNIYLYQIEFVGMFAEHHFRKIFADLDILDWGCGKGHVTFFLRKHGARPVSCDYFSGDEADDDSTFGQNTPIIQNTGIIVDRLNDSIKLPYGDSKFDVLLSVGVLEHVQNDSESLREIHRVLRPDGLFFCFNLPYVLSWTQRFMHMRGDFYHDRLYSKGRVKRLLGDADFGLLDIWHRQLFPKNTVRYPAYRMFESIDQFLSRATWFKYLATNIEFVASAIKN
jgi:SAM-dependent methyltransferase